MNREIGNLSRVIAESFADRIIFEFFFLLSSIVNRCTGANVLDGSMGFWSLAKSKF